LDFYCICVEQTAYCFLQTLSIFFWKTIVDYGLANEDNDDNDDNVHDDDNIQPICQLGLWALS
jgi:hypothetical protein